MANHSMMQRPSNKSAAIILALVLLLPVVYVLSTGPVAWMQHHDFVGEDPAYTVYAPIRWAVQHSSTVAWAMKRYLVLWGVPVE